MRKKQRELRAHYRQRYVNHRAAHHVWKKKGKFPATYPLFIEEQLYRAENDVKNIQKYIHKLENRLGAVGFYIHDMDKGLRIVDRAVDTLKAGDGEVVIQAVRWLTRTLADAKRIFEKGEIEQSMGGE